MAASSGVAILLFVMKFTALENFQVENDFACNVTVGCRFSVLHSHTESRGLAVRQLTIQKEVKDE